MFAEILSLSSIEGLNGLNIGDLILLITILVAWPIYSHITLKRLDIDKLREDPNFRNSTYNITMLHLWGLAISILLVWSLANRPYAALGFYHELNMATVIVWMVAALGLLFCAQQLHRVIHNQAARSKIEKQLKDVGEFTELLMPKTRQEHRRSMLVGITAGITEEIIFRGYLIWIFSLFIHPWLAGIMSIAVFGLLHRYQDQSGLIQVIFFASISTVMYLATGSLWPVIVLHIGVDMLNISLALIVGKSTEETAAKSTQPQRRS